MKRAAILRDRFVLTLIAVALFVVGFVALYWPVSLGDYDRWGFQISCGSSFVADYAQAATTDQATAPAPQQQARADGDHVTACRSAIWWRRAWATALVVAGVAGLGALLLGRLATARRR